MLYNWLSIADSSIACTNIGNTNDFQHLLADPTDPTTGSQANNFNHSEPIYVSDRLPIETHLNLPIDNNIDSSSSYLTHQMITR